MLKDAINIQSAARVGIAGQPSSKAIAKVSKLKVESTALVIKSGRLPRL